MSNIYFVNYSMGLDGIRTTECGAFNTEKDVRLFLDTSHPISGWVSKHSYKLDDSFVFSELMGYFGGFKPSAQEGVGMSSAITEDFDRTGARSQDGHYERY